MTITFRVEARNEDEAIALASEGAPTLHVHNRGAALILLAVEVRPQPWGEIDARDLLERLDSHREIYLDTLHDVVYLIERLPRLRAVAVAADALGRRVVWS